jgi:hypothetical protein
MIYPQNERFIARRSANAHIQSDRRVIVRAGSEHRRIAPVRTTKLYLLTAFALLTATAASSVADIPPTPEQKKKIAETPRTMPKGEVTPLGERSFARAVGGGKAKVIIPRAIFDELAAAVAAKPGANAVPASKKGAIPPIALVFAGLALSGACLYAIAKAPRYRTVAATTAIAIVAGLALMSTRQADANAGPIRRRDEGQIILEVPAEGSEVVIYIPEPAPKPAAETPK